MISIQGKTEILEKLERLEETITGEDTGLGWNVYLTEAQRCLIEDEYDALEQCLFAMHLALGDQLSDVSQILNRIKQLRSKLW